MNTQTIIDHPDDVRREALAALFKSPEVEIIGRTLANIERQRIGLWPILALEDLEREEAHYYREHAVRAIRTLNQQDIDEAIYIGAKLYAEKAWSAGFEGLSEHRKGHCVWAVRSIVNMFGHVLSGHLPASGAEARAWKALEAKMDGKLAKREAVTV